jgi:hypothetical protein
MWLLAVAIALQSVPTERPEQPVTLSLCALVRHSSDHHNKLVRVEATLMPHPEGGYLYDRRCNNRDFWVWPELSPNYAWPADLWRQAQIGIDQKARLVLVGRFQAANGEGYGHLAGFRQQIVVMVDESVRRAPTDEQGGDNGAPSPLSRAEKQLRELDEKWLLASTDSDSQTLATILSEGYVRVLPSDQIEYRPQVLASPQLPHTLATPRAGEARDAIRFGWRVRVFLSNTDSAVVIRNVERFKDRVAAARALNPTDEYEYVNLYRRTEGQWQLTFSRLEHHPKGD